MPRIASLSKNEMASKLADVFMANGYEGASLSKLAEVTNLSRASLYHHFPAGKEDMAKAALAFKGMQFQANILAPLSGRDATDALVRSLDGVLDYYDDENPVCLMNVLSLGEGGHLFGRNIAAAFGAWADALAGQLVGLSVAPTKAEKMAQRFIAHIQGALVVARVQGDRAPLNLAVDAIKTEILDLRT